MSKPAPAPVEGEKPKSSGKLLVIIIVVLLLVIIGGAAAFFLLKGSDEAGDEEEVAHEVKKPKKKKGEKEAPPVYLPMDRFTVNLIPETGDQYLQVEISVEMEDAHEGEKLKLHMPKLRNQVMLLLSSKKASELNAKEGKETLAKEMRAQINKVLDSTAKDGEGPVKEVLFTSFIIQ